MYQAARRGRRVPREFKRLMPLGAEYLGEDDSYWYYVEAGANPTLELGGLFNIGKMFKRMTKFTPSSFKMRNILGAIGSVGLTGLTFGLAPKISSAHSKIAPIWGGAMLAAGAAVVAGPAILTMIGPKLAAAGEMLGKSSSAIGGTLFDLLGKFTGGQQAEVAQRVTPQDIAYMEQNQGAVPPSLLPFLDQAAARSMPVMQAPNSAAMNYGAASLYDPSQSYATGGPAPVEAGLFDRMDTKTMLLLFGLPTAFFVLQTFMKKGRQ